VNTPLCDVLHQVSIIERRRVIKGKEPEFEAALARMYDYCMVNVSGSRGASFLRPIPGDRTNEYQVT
jgi:hypothetical protein